MKLEEGQVPCAVELHVCSHVASERDLLTSASCISACIRLESETGGSAVKRHIFSHRTSEQDFLTSALCNSARTLLVSEVLGRAGAPRNEAAHLQPHGQ